MKSALQAPPPTNKLILGTIVLAASILSHLSISLVVDSSFPDGVRTDISGLLVIEILEVGMLVALAIMSKDGYEWLKKRIRVLFRFYCPSHTVSATRYRMSLLMFSLVVLVSFVLPYSLYFFPDFEISLRVIFYIAISCDAIFILSLIILGGGFWDKLHGLFHYNSAAVFNKHDYEK